MPILGEELPDVQVLDAPDSPQGQGSGSRRHGRHPRRAYPPGGLAPSNPNVGSPTHMRTVEGVGAELDALATVGADVAAPATLRVTPDVVATLASKCRPASGSPADVPQW